MKRLQKKLSGRIFSSIRRRSRLPGWQKPVSVITFKVKLGDIHKIYCNSLIAEIVKYNITKVLFGFDYEFEFTGMTVRDVPPQNILSIEEIKDYIQMQEKYPDYERFYDELKS